MPSWAVILVAGEAERRRRVELNALRRTIRGGSDPFAIPNQEFGRLFRLPKQLVWSLTQVLEPHLRRTRGHGVAPQLQVLSTLRFLAEGGYQRGVGQDMFIPLAQPTVSVIVRCVTRATVVELGHLVAFPKNARERKETEEKFRRVAQFPGVLGCVDGTHVSIYTPTVNEEAFVNHSGYHSLNVQMICDWDLRITNVVAKYPGAVHDQFIFNFSEVRHEMERLSRNRIGSFFLLGDSGYKVEPFLLTPLPHALPDTPEFLYTKAHMSTRNCVERCFGVLKTRFRCLLKERVLHYRPEQAGVIVMACAVLHNYMQLAGVPEPDDLVSEDPPTVAPSYEADRQDGRNVRATIVRKYFQL